jgi:hypothetical protein
MVAGAARLTQLTTGAAVTADNARFFASPTPVVLHIIGATLFSILGALQFAPRLRRRSWHRTAGKVVFVAGFVAATSGLWMSVFYPRPPQDAFSLEVVRIVVGVAMTAFLVLGLLRIRSSDVAAHRAWMMRGYALGLGAGTQVLTHIPWLVLFGAPSGWTRTMLMSAGWIINLAVAEWFIRTRPLPAATSRRAHLVPTLSR